jgi:hypothetical protein
MRWRLLAAIGLVASVIIIDLVIAQDCTSERCVELPAVANPGPTQALTPTHTPLPQSPDTSFCLSHGPAPTEGAQVWMTAYNLASGAKALICSRLTLDGAPVSNALVRVLARYPDRNQAVDSGLTRVDGIFALRFTAGSVQPYQLVAIEAEIALNGRLYGATTQFLGQPAATAAPSLTPTRTRTPAAPPVPTDTPTSTPTL